MTAKRYGEAEPAGGRYGEAESESEPISIRRRLSGVRPDHFGYGPGSYTKETWMGHNTTLQPPTSEPRPPGWRSTRLCCVGLLEKKEFEGKKIIYMTTLTQTK